jgi:hypothetical protein
LHDEASIRAYRIYAIPDIAAIGVALPFAILPYRNIQSARYFFMLGRVWKNTSEHPLLIVEACYHESTASSRLQTWLRRLRYS